MVLEGSRPTFCIVIPMFNEEKVAEKCVATIHPYLRDLPCRGQLLIVNDGSCDGTKGVLAQLSKDLDPATFHVVHHETNQGYGAALKSGMQYAIERNFDYVLFMDSDLTNHPRHLKDFCQKMMEGCAYIKASRYIKGGRVEDVPLYKRLVSRVGNGIAKMLYRLPISDYTNGFRAVKTDLLKKFDLHERGFVIIMEELYQAKKWTHSFDEVPYTLTSRKGDEGLTHFSYGPKACWQYFQYALKSAFLRSLNTKGMCHADSNTK